MTIGKRIKKQREVQQLTLNELAKKVGCATQTIFKYENEIITNIPLDKLEKIADALHVTPAYLMGWEDFISIKMKIKDSQEENTITITENQYEKILKFLEIIDE